MVVRLYDKNSQPFQSGKASEMEVISLDEVGEGLVTSFRTSYNVEADDILIPTGSIDYVKEDGFSGNPRMRVVVEKHRSTLQSGTYTVEFKDTNGDNVGDEYHVIQTGAEGNIIDEDIVYLGGFAVQFIRPWVGTEGTHIYTIYTEVDESSTVNTGLTEWLLHVDVRTPKGNDDCNDVSGFEYDGSQVVVVDGTKQSFDIPILLNPNSRRSEETCADKYSIEEITKEKDCICGRSTTENCAEGSYKYCVDDMCRRYPACVSGENNEPCVCSGSGINLNEYDCAYRNDESSADFYERGDKEAKYCVDKRCVKEVGSDFVPSPTILLGESRIEETVQGASRMVFFRADSIVSVQSKFNVEIVVDGNGHDVGKVEVIIGERESVELELQPPADKKKGIWTKEVDLHNVNNMEELRFSVRATTGSKVTNSDIVGIKIVGIAE